MKPVFDSIEDDLNKDDRFEVCSDSGSSQYGVITGEEQSPSGEESNEFVVDLKQKPVPMRSATRTRNIKAVGVGMDKIPGAEVWDDDDEEEECVAPEVMNTLAKSLQLV